MKTMKWQFSTLQIEDDASNFMAYIFNLLEPEFTRKNRKFVITSIWQIQIYSTPVFGSLHFSENYNETIVWVLMFQNLFLSTLYLSKFLFRKSDPNCCLYDFSPVPLLACIIFFLPHKHVYKKPKQVQKELYNIFCIFGDYN